MLWTNFQPRSFKQLHVHICALRKATVNLYLNVIQAQVTYVVPQLAHEREEAESGGLLVIKDCFNVDYTRTGWQKLPGSTGGTHRKVWTRTKILNPNIRYFVAN